jgi:hypothetical protein
LEYSAEPGRISPLTLVPIGKPHSKCVFSNQNYVLLIVMLAKDPKMHPGRLDKCCVAWRHEACPALCRWTVCGPTKVTVCVADYIGRLGIICCSTKSPSDVIANHPNDPGCCTTCIFRYFPLCMPDCYMTEDPNNAFGVKCADHYCTGCWELDGSLDGCDFCRMTFCCPFCGIVFCCPFCFICFGFHWWLRQVSK